MVLTLLKTSYIYLCKFKNLIKYTNSISTASFHSPFEMSGWYSTNSRLFLLAVLLAVIHSVQGKEGKDANAGVSKEMANLEILLINNWKEMDKMLLCTKSPKCVKNYLKNIKIGNTMVKANLIQSMRITLDIIKQLTEKLKEKKR